MLVKDKRKHRGSKYEHRSRNFLSNYSIKYKGAAGVSFIFDITFLIYSRVLVTQLSSRLNIL